VIKSRRMRRARHVEIGNAYTILFGKKKRKEDDIKMELK
jgi:hypothetical protein